MLWHRLGACGGVAYWTQAANQGSLDWGVIDTGLYNDAFAGRAKTIHRCTLSC